MALPFPADLPPLFEEQFERRLFTRRSDLTNTIRLTIATDALHAMTNNAWGTYMDSSWYCNLFFAGQ
jgi:hypothetical protein